MSRRTPSPTDRVRPANKNVPSPLPHVTTKLTRALLGTLAGFTPSGGTFDTYFGTLKRHGLLTEAANGDVEITKKA